MVDKQSTLQANDHIAGIHDCANFMMSFHSNFDGLNAVDSSLIESLAAATRTKYHCHDSLAVEFIAAKSSHWFGVTWLGVN